MGTTSKIISRKFYSQLYNGATFASNLTDFTTNLVGSAGEKIKEYSSCRSRLVEWCN